MAKDTPKKTQKPDTEKMTKAPSKDTQPASEKPRKLGTVKSIAGVLLAILVVAFIWVFLPLSGTSGPANAVRTAWDAVESKDLGTFQKVVNTDALVKSLIEQVIAYEEINAEGATANNFRQLMSQGMIGAFRNDLAATYNIQLNELVETGNLGQRKDGLLWRLWQQTGAKPEYFVDYEVLDQNDQNALLTLNFERPDLDGAVLSLNLLLEHNSQKDSWQVTGAPNLANFLFTINQRQKEQLAELNAPIQKRLNETVNVIDVQKSGGVGETSNGVLWRVAYRNTSSRNIESFDATITIKNANDQHLGELKISDDDGLASGQTAERAWPMPLSTSNSAEAEILTASPRTLQTEVTITKVVFKNGDRLTLFKELPTTVTTPNEAAE